jgi:hypothetical protein
MCEIPRSPAKRFREGSGITGLVAPQVGRSWRLGVEVGAVLRRIALAVTVVASFLVTGGAVAAPVNPLDGPYPQVHGEMVTGIPVGKPCTVTLAKDFRFHNTAYGQDQPFTGDYVPGCKGPWSKVVMTMASTVKTGTQFDRIGDVLIGGVTMLHLTTAEGESGETSWSIQRDVTGYASVLAKKQPAYFIIGNQTDGTYTGDFYGTLTFDFYKGTTPVVADQVIGLSPGVDKGLPTRSNDKPLTSSVVLPRNATALTAEVFASGHGAEEEDWWNAPFACVSGGIPYREVSVAVDGRLGGIAPVFPTIYTGGYGPDFWRPFPSPRAYDLRPYALDLTPYVGQLTDGKPHAISIATIGQSGCEGYWFLGGNLLVTTNHKSTARTTGSVTAVVGGAKPTSTTLGAQGLVLSDRTTSAHHLEVTGVVRAAGFAPVTVKVVHDATNTAIDAALDVDADWTWDATVTRNGVTALTQHSTYGLLRTGPTWSISDDYDLTASNRTWTYRDTMHTGGPVVGITGVVGASEETWSLKGSDGTCATHQLVGAVQNVLVDTVDTTC